MSRHTVLAYDMFLFKGMLYNFHIRRGFLALLVLTKKGNARALTSEMSDIVQTLTLLFYICTNWNNYLVCW